VTTDELSRRAFLFFWEQSHPKTGLTKDRAKNDGSKDDYTVCSIAATGYALAALPIGVKNKWISRSEAEARALLTLRSVTDKLDGAHGFFYHFVDWATGKRVWNCELSSIDSSLLVLGTLVAGEFFRGECKTLADGLLARMDWRWMQNGPESLAPTMGHKPESGFLDARWGGYSEALYLYLLGLSGSLPKEAWDAWKFPESIPFGDATPLFFSQMAPGFFDLRNKKDSHRRAWWKNFEAQHRLHLAFCKSYPALYPDGLFGINACDQPPPVGYGAQEPREGRHDGTICPTAILAAMLFVPGEAKTALESLEKRVKPGRYGFPNAVNFSKNWIDTDVLGIDLGMALLALENKRSGLVWKLLVKNKNIQRGLSRAGMI
jgi:hypothetical protein